jgi:hypothetical protein
MGTTVTITFDKTMTDLDAGAFGLWLDATIRASAHDDPGADYGRATISYRHDP